MYNWNTNTKILKKKRHDYVIWKLEQMINFGLNGARIDKQQLKKFWKKLHLDPDKKQFLKMLLWKEKS